MSRFLMLVATASLLSVATQAALAQEGHEKPEPQPGTAQAVRVEMQAGSLYSPYDLASSGLSRKDMVSVSNFVAPTRKEDRPSRNDH